MLFVVGNGMVATAKAADVQKIVLASCANCQQVDGNSVDPKIPKIAGQEAGYIRKQLRLYASATRRHEDMTTAASALSEDEISELAQYFSAQRVSPGKINDVRLLFNFHFDKTSIIHGQ